jgi:hypothetical protein
MIDFALCFPDNKPIIIIEVKGLGKADFPTVPKEMAIALLDVANKLLTSKNVAQLYASVA